MSRLAARWRKNRENISALVLGASALATAWSSYQAGTWSGIQTLNYSRADQMRTVTVRVNNEAARLRMIDLYLFSRWLEASSAGDQTIAKLYEDHFRPEFRPAFDAWRKGPPPAAGLPFSRPEYRPQRIDEAAAIDDSADKRFRMAASANETSDRYIAVTVIMATVLFFAGAVRPLITGRAQDVVLIFAIVLCLVGLGRLVTSPLAR